MTEAAIFTMGRSGIIGYGKIRPLADNRSRLLNLKNIYIVHLFVDLSNSMKSFNHYLTKPCKNLG